MLAALHSAPLDPRVAIDEEGGAKVTNSKARFVAPGLAVFAAQASLERDVIDAGEIGNLTDIPGANVGGRALGGFAGLGVLGVAVGQISRPVAAALGFYGLAQAIYISIVAKGRDVVFPENTPLRLQLSPGSVNKR